MSDLQTLTEGQKCPSCGRKVVAPMHSCHEIRDNYPVERKSDTSDTSDTLLDTLASNARTALDDPDPDVFTDPEYARAFVIRRLDEIIEALNPSYETRETFADTLTILGRHLAERADVMESVDADGPSGDRAAYVNAAGLVHRALDSLDEAIAELQQDETMEHELADAKGRPGVRHPGFGPLDDPPEDWDGSRPLQ